MMLDREQTRRFAARLCDWVDELRSGEYVLGVDEERDRRSVELMERLYWDASFLEVTYPTGERRQRLVEQMPDLLFYKLVDPALDKDMMLFMATDPKDSTVLDYKTNRVLGLNNDRQADTRRVMSRAYWQDVPALLDDLSRRTLKGYSAAYLAARLSWHQGDVDERTRFLADHTYGFDVVERSRDIDMYRRDVGRDPAAHPQWVIAAREAGLIPSSARQLQEGFHPADWWYPQCDPTRVQEPALTGVGAVLAEGDEPARAR